jgi:hypothetical protein
MKPENKSEEHKEMMGLNRLYLGTTFYFTQHAEFD